MFKSAVRRVRSLRPSLESLEGRALLSTVHLTVNTLADDPSGPVAGQTTLRDAITAADAVPAGDKAVIKFAVNGTIALSQPLPDLTGNIAINGPGAANLTVQGTVRSDFVIQSAIVTISNITLTDSEWIPYTGGAISNSGDLTLTHVSIVNCFGFYDGGAIFNSGTLIVKNSIFANDYSSDGGSIFNTGTETIENSTFTGGASAYGAAIYTAGSTTIKGCSFSDNNASFEGGAILVTGNGILKVSNSTFTNNGGEATGSDIYNAGTLTIGKKLLTDLGTGIYNIGTIN